MAGISIIPAIFKDLNTTFSAESLKTSPLSNPDQKLMAEKFKKRKEFIIGDSKAAFAAHLIDPHFLGRCMSCDEISQACDLVVSLAGAENTDFITELAAFRTKTDSFQYSFMWAGVGKDDEMIEKVIDRRAKLPPLRW